MSGDWVAALLEMEEEERLESLVAVIRSLERRISELEDLLEVDD